MVLLPFVYCQVVDVSSVVHELYFHLDPVSLESLVTEVSYFSAVIVLLQWSH